MFSVVGYRGDEVWVQGHSFLTIETAEAYQAACYAARKLGDDADFTIELAVG